jgi:hypothetical protein
MPHLTIGVTVGPKPHQAMVHVVATGSGKEYAGFILRSPDGHSVNGGTFYYRGGTRFGHPLYFLSSGTYGYTVYALPEPAQTPLVFPASGHVTKNIVASGSFSVP